MKQIKKSMIKPMKKKLPLKAVYIPAKKKQA